MAPSQRRTKLPWVLLGDLLRSPRGWWDTPLPQPTPRSPPGLTKHCWEDFLDSCVASSHEAMEATWDHAGTGVTGAETAPSISA